MKDNLIYMNTAPKKQKRTRRQMLDWYIDNVKNAGVSRNPMAGKLKGTPLWNEVSNPNFMWKGKETDLCNYCARTYIDNLDAKDMQAILNLVDSLTEEMTHNPNVYIDETHQHNLFTVRNNLAKGHYDLGFHWKHKENRSERWHLVQTLFEIIDQA